ncbi:curli-like amyloid fiber formation chaperone CsgH [Maribacter antarcticus]|uniref:curli-like amyloid fiber formation chaperone CsgH n=1 Tax=Maribacter antarcticus TaxID=505250 RepID=UPI00047CFB38|nr:curli-like amyloid fiber formation chaperone CsgH [Maribacter antarcticus]
MFEKIIVVGGVLLMSLVGTAQESDMLKSAITVEPIKNNRVSISGLCANNTSQSKNFRYVLSVEKTGQSGNTNKNKQSGAFNLAPAESKILSSTTINFEPNDYTAIVFTIFDVDNVQIAQHKKVLTETDFKK